MLDDMIAEIESWRNVNSKDVDYILEFLEAEIEDRDVEGKAPKDVLAEILEDCPK